MLKRHLLLAVLVGGALGVAGMQLVPAQAQQTARAYYVADFELQDAEGIRPYSAGMPSTLAPYGGHFVARGGRVATLEGAAPGARSVIIEFPSMAQAQAWYSSPEYSALRPVRQRSGVTRAFIIEGVPN